MLSFVRFDAIISLMTNLAEILKAAELVQSRVVLDDYYPVVVKLRDKGLAWREIAGFLKSHGVETDHSKVFRMFCKAEQIKAFAVPSAHAYAQALSALEAKGQINAAAKAMLAHHYKAHNRTVTYTQLAQAAADRDESKSVTDKVTHKTANLVYGKLGRLLGETMNMQFAPADDRGGLFYSSSIGFENPLVVPGMNFELVMHHELSKALDTLGWFKG